jgi:predicted RND superfamily exporter protein
MGKRSFLDKNATRILVVSVLLAPLACFGALKAIKGNKNDVSDWLPESYQETTELRWFRDHFLADQFVIISWDGCQIGDDPTGAQDDPRIAQLSEALLAQKLPASAKAEDRTVFKQVTSARTVMRELMSPPTDLSRKRAVERLKGSLLGPDGKQTCVMATLTPAASAHLRQTIGRPVKRLLRTVPETPLWAAINSVPGLDASKVRLGGPPIDNTAIDEEGERTLVRLAGLSGLLGISLAYYSLRSVWMTAVVFICGILSAALSLAMVPLLGFSMDAVLMSMPALVYVLAVSGAVHIINYYRQEMRDGNFDHAVEHAVKHAWRPAILCSTTTAIGLASLLTSDIIPIAKFGGFSAIGVVTMLAILFLVLPAAIKKWPWIPPELRVEGDSHAVRNSTTEGEAFGAKGWGRYANMIRRHHALVFAASMACIVALCAGLPKITTSIDLLKLFSEDAQLLKDYKWYEANLGRIVPMELVIRFPREVQQEYAPPNETPGQLVDRLTFLERLEMVGRVQASISQRLGAEGEDIVGATMSAVTFGPNLNAEGSGVGKNSYRSIANEQLARHREDFIRAGYLRDEAPTKDRPEGDELWRISVRVAAFHGMDHGELVNRVRDAIEPVVVAHEASIRSMQSLAQRRHGQPNGARVLLWNAGEGADALADVGASLEAKNIAAFNVKKPIDQATDQQLASYAAKFDGVVLGSGFSERDANRLRKAGVPILATIDSAKIAQASAGDDAVGVVYTGVIPVVYKAQRALLDSLVESTWWSFITITPLMMWVCRGFAPGIIVMVPNTLPVLVVFGGMGWLGIPVDIGSMMAASIALGVAVDDTIHFLAWFKDDLKKLGNRDNAVVTSYQRSGTAALQAALINGLGLSVFATSSFTPTQQFGWLMLCILMAGIVAELVMLPAMLFGPIGKVFELKPARKEARAIESPRRLDAVGPVLDHGHSLREHGASVKG